MAERCQWCRRDVGNQLVTIPRDCGRHRLRLCSTCALGALLVQRGADQGVCEHGDLWVVVGWA